MCDWERDKHVSLQFDLLWFHALTHVKSLRAAPQPPPFDLIGYHPQAEGLNICMFSCIALCCFYLCFPSPPPPHRLQSKQEGSVTEICSVTPPTPYCCLLLGVSPFVCVRPLFLMGHWDMCVSQYQLMDCRGQCTPALPLILLPLSFLSLMFPFTQGEQHIPENCESSLFHSKRLTLDKCTYVWNVIIYL